MFSVRTVRLCVCSCATYSEDKGEVGKGRGRENLRLISVVIWANAGGPAPIAHLMSDLR